MSMDPKNFDPFLQLPEAIVIFIISLLPFGDAVRTSVLSKSWYKLWTFTTSIVFDEKHFTETRYERPFLGSSQSSKTYPVRKVSRERLIDSVRHTLPYLQMKKITKFQLRFCYTPAYHYPIYQLINFSMKKNMEELHLDFSPGIPIEVFDLFMEPIFTLPEFIYYYGRKFFRVVNLSSCNLGSFNFAGFDLLRNVSLARIMLPKEAVSNLVNNCPLLEVLSLVECRCLYHIDIAYRHLGLKRLIVRDCKPLSYGIDLCAPNLRYFEYFGHVVTFYVENLVNLVDAVVDFGLQMVFFHSHAVELSDLLLDLFNAKALTVCSYLLKILPTEDYLFYQLPEPLLNLRHLTLKTTLDRPEVIGTLSLLRSSPKLETLCIQTCFSWFIVEFTRIPVPIPFKHLKKVEVEDFQGSGNEIGFLKFLLQHARSLESMIIKLNKHYSFGISPENASLISDAMNDLKGSEHASPHVMIWFQFGSING